MKDHVSGFGAANVAPMPSQPFVGTTPASSSPYQFYRCWHCGRVLTRAEELVAFSPSSPHPGIICPCGSSRYSPSMPRGLEWYSLRMLRYLWSLWTVAGETGRLAFVAWVIRESRE